MLEVVGYLRSRALRQWSVHPISSGASETEFQTKQSGLLAAVAAQLIVFFKTEGTFDPKDDPRKEPILTLAYVALVLSIGATISSLILTDEFADIPVRAARSPYDLESSKTKSPKSGPSTTEPSKAEDPKDDTTFNGHDWGLLRVFGLRGSAQFVVAHCRSYSEPWVPC
jgi:hypothetical protein